MNNQSLVQAGNFLSTLYNPIQKREVITVNGVAEAQNFRLEKGESVALIDCNSDILYIKESDDLGKATLRIYECKEKTKEYLDKLTPATISKSDFDQLKNQLSHLTEILSKGARYDDSKQKN